MGAAQIAADTDDRDGRDQVDAEERIPGGNVGQIEIATGEREQEASG